MKRNQNYNVLFNALEFMVKLLEGQKNIRFSGAGSSNKNGEAECTIKKVVAVLNTIIVLLLYFFPEVGVMCLNHDVVVFQPWTGTALYLGFFTNYTFYSNPPAPSVSTNFLDLCIAPLYPINPHKSFSSSYTLSIALFTHILS